MRSRLIINCDNKRIQEQMAQVGTAIAHVARREILHYQARNSALRGMVKSAHFAQCKIDSIFLAI